MLSFDKPKKLDGIALVEELVVAGVSIKANGNFENGKEPPVVNSEGKLLLAIEESDYELAAEVIANHNG